MAPNFVPHFSLKDGLLRYMNRLWLGTNTDLKYKVLVAFHASPMGGHSGVPVTYRRLKQVFA